MPKNHESRFSRRQVLVGGAAATATLAAGAPTLAKPADAKQAKELWGPRVDLSGLEELYGPREVTPHTVVPGGIDNLGLYSTDVFEISRFGAGVFEVSFNGYFRVARSHPSTMDWTTFSVRVNIVDLQLSGSDQELGAIKVRLNPNVLSTGEIFPARSPDDPAQCRIATAVYFDVPALGTSLFNKEPILLMNDHVVSIPPVDDPSGQALLYKLPLFDLEDPDGLPLAYLTSLRYGADHYLTPDQVKAIKAS